MSELTIEKVQKAGQLLQGAVHKTSLDYSTTFSNLTDAHIYLKLENMQKTGSFKIRGALNKINGLKQQERFMGVVTASAGNHGQGVAYAAARAGIRAKVVMPVASPISKVLATQGYGAEVILWGQDYDDAYAKALEIREETGATYIHSFDDPEVIAGQGTLGLEILNQLPTVEAVVAPVGGGGLLSGIAFVVKTLSPKAKVFGVQSDAASAMYQKWKGFSPKVSGSSGTIADGIYVRNPGLITEKLISKYVDDIVLVNDEEITQAMMLLLERTKLIAEGAGAAALAALLNGRLNVRGLKTVVLISGGNVDVNLISTVIERGLVKSGRRLRLRTVISDRPGSLQKIISLISEHKVNIISIQHDRISPRISIKDAEVEFVLETRNLNQVGEIIDILKQAGYSLEVL